MNMDRFMEIPAWLSNNKKQNVLLLHFPKDCDLVSMLIFKHFLLISRYLKMYSWNWKLYRCYYTLLDLIKFEIKPISSVRYCVISWNSHSKQVLQFNNEISRYRFVKKLSKLLKSKGKKLKRYEETESNVYQRAVTKEKRQEMLSNFFKKVFAEVFYGNITIIPNVSLIFS